jgi:outer membrane protein OmpA-like peptidoglycan-associated protein
MEQDPFSENASPQDEHWIPLSDLMTGLMMIFMLIALSYMIKVESVNARIRTIAVRYNQLHVDLYQDLTKEFTPDLKGWGAEIHKDLSISFKEPDILFDTGSDTIKPRFREILTNFFPRYVRILSSPKYRDSIREIRVEGHTSSFWKGAVSTDDAYFRNMALSQARTRTTLEYVLTLPQVLHEKNWLKKLLTANGLSSSHLVFDNGGREDFSQSQRVEFRVRTNAEAKIANIIEASKE